MKSYFFGFITLCGLFAVTALRAQQNDPKIRAYIERYAPLAVKEMQVYKIPASITMAQGIIESDRGESPLAQKSNNHFGIKCKKDWTGQTVSHDDDAPGECFRKYDCVEDSYADHSRFLTGSLRYASLFELDLTDYKGWAHGLKAAGYATNPHYPQLLINMIERYELYRLDTEGLAALQSETKKEPVTAQVTEPSPDVPAGGTVVVTAGTGRMLGGRRVEQVNGVDMVRTKEGDTYQKLAQQLGIGLDKLCKYNDMELKRGPLDYTGIVPNDPVEPGTVVYVAKKKKKSASKYYHIAGANETLRSVSQQYGVRVKNLKKMNRTTNPYEELKLDERIRLR